MIRAFGLAILKAVLILVGLFVVPALIPFRKTDESTRLPSGWVFSNFGTWFGNPFDGLCGDKRLDYLTELGLTEPTFWSMWLWAAWRNPVNYWSRLVAGCDVSRCSIVKVCGSDTVVEEPGQGGAQYLIGTRDDGKKFPRVLVVLPYPFLPTRAFMLDLGWKIKLSHNGTLPDARPQDKYKGLVFTGSLFKTLE